MLISELEGVEVRDKIAEVTLGGMTWSIVEFITDEFHGLCDVDQNTIYLNLNYPKDIVSNTLIHECLHGFLYHHGGGLDWEDEGLIRHLAATVQTLLASEDITTILGFKRCKT